MDVEIAKRITRRKIPHREKNARQLKNRAVAATLQALSGAHTLFQESGAIRSSISVFLGGAEACDKVVVGGREQELGFRVQMPSKRIPVIPQFPYSGVAVNGKDKWVKPVVKRIRQSQNVDIGI